MSTKKSPAKGSTELFEDYSVKPVPTVKTRSWFDLGIIIWGNCICIPAFMVGGVLGSSEKFATVLLAMIIGSLILTVISVSTGVIGSHTRLSTAMTAQFTFGRRANILIAVILGIVGFGWFGVQLELFGGAVAGAIGILSNNTVTVPGWIVVFAGGILMVATAIYGFRALAWLSYVAVPVLLLVLLITLFQSTANTTLADVFAKTPAQTLPFGTLISIVVGALAMGAVIQPDLTRYGKSRMQTAWGMVFGLMFGFLAMIILPAYLAVAAGNADFTAILLSYNSGFAGVLAMFSIILSAWVANDNNIYSSALAFNAIFPKVKKWIVTAVGGLIGTLLALAGIMMQFANFLTILSIAIPPIGAVMAIDFALFNSPNYRYSALKDLPAVRVESWISWVLGVAVGVLTNFKVFTLTGTSALDSIIVAVIAHIVIMFAFGQKTNPIAEPEVIA